MFSSFIRRVVLPLFLSGSLFLAGGVSGASAADAPSAGDLRAVYALLISASDQNFETYKGEKITTNQNGTFYQAKPVAGMVPSPQFVGLTKGYYFYIAVVTAPESVKALREAFLGLPDYQNGKAGYVLQPDRAASSEQQEVTNLLVNGHKMVVYAKGLGEVKDVITIGPFGGRAPAENEPVAAELDPKTRAFTAGTQMLVRAAAGDFSGMVKDLIRKTGDGDSMFNVTPVPEMQTQDDGQVVMLTENRHFYLNSYDTPEEVEFALAAFLALPTNIKQDHAYTVEIDQRLEKPSSTTYHLRYNGQIVADFIKFKNKPKAFFTVGYRDGIPKGLVMGRTYSGAAVEGAKQMINEATTCAGCHGLGVEEIDTGWEYKNSGIHEKKWVPCHYCHGTGHL